MKTLAGMTALVTGAGKRIGRAMARALAREGVNIIIHYNTSEEEARGAASELEGLGVKTWTVKADFGNPAEYVDLIERCRKLAGGFDVLVNSASVFPRSTINTIEYGGFLECMQVNAWVPFVLGREFAKHSGKGSIVNLIDSRISGFDFTHVGYLWSKHILYEMTRLMAVEFAPGVTVNGINPGLILPPPGRSTGYLEKMKNTVPMKRHGDPEEIADAVVFLARNDFITGEVICIDGGRHLWEYVSGPHPD